MKKTTVVSFDNSIAGLVGNVWNGNVVNMTDCNLEEILVFGSQGIGGLIGRIKKSTVVNITDCTIKKKSTISGSQHTGGLIGYIEKVDDLNITSCNAEDITVSGNPKYAGGMIGYLKSAKNTIKDCTVLRTSVSGYQYVGGIFGYGSSTEVTITTCKIADSSLSSVSNSLGGIIGESQDKLSRLRYCDVINTTIQSKSSATVGGLVGLFASGVITDCNVSYCDPISGSSIVGGLVGKSSSKQPITRCNVLHCNITAMTGQQGGLVGLWPGAIVNDSSISDSVLYSINKLSIGPLGGLLGGPSPGNFHPHTLNNNTVRNVTISLNEDVTKSEYAYLYDANKLAQIHSTKGTAKLAQINLENNNTVINSSIMHRGAEENTDLSEFADMQTKFNITVSNPKITSIAAQRFKEKQLTGIFNISSVTSIGANAFSGTQIPAGFYLPKSVTLDPNAFSGATTLQIIYGSSIEGLPTAPALINITEEGTLPNVKPGSFTPAQSNGNTFETVKLGNNYANKFKNLTSGEYLDATDSWTAGNAYLAVWNGTVISFAYNDGSGKTISANATVNNGTLNPALPSPTRSGYTFLGWYNESTGGVQIIDDDGNLIAGVAGYTDADGNWINETPGMTLYAQWKKNEQPYTPSRRESGYTVILPENTTATPTPTPVATIQPVGNSTIKPTTLPTQSTTSKSPAPFFGLVLGLGAAALLMRMRR